MVDYQRLNLCLETFLKFYKVILDDPPSGRGAMTALHIAIYDAPQYELLSVVLRCIERGVLPSIER
jgi:hypothetical protein